MNVDPRLVRNSPSGGSIVMSSPKAFASKKSQQFNQFITPLASMKTLSTNSSVSKIVRTSPTKNTQGNSSILQRLDSSSKGKQLERGLWGPNNFEKRKKNARPKTSTSYDGFFKKIFHDKADAEEEPIQDFDKSPILNLEKKRPPQLISKQYVHLRNTSGMPDSIKESIKGSEVSTSKAAEKHLKVFLLDSPSGEAVRTANSNFQPLVERRLKKENSKKAENKERRNVAIKLLSRSEIAGGNREFDDDLKTTKGAEDPVIWRKATASGAEKKEASHEADKAAKRDAENYTAWRRDDGCEASSGSEELKNFSRKNPGDDQSSPQHNARNKFSKVDSKYAEIKELKKQNKLLEKKLRELQSEVDEIDEFQMVVRGYPRGKETSDESFNEKRVNYLKAQIEKQRRYIMKLNSTLKLCKKFQRDFVSFLKIFQEMSRKYESLSFLNQKEAAVKRNEHRDEKVMLSELDILMKRNALDRLLKRTMENPEELIEKFINNFNEAYEKVLVDERKNEEFKRLFVVEGSEKEQKSSVKYKYPMREFTSKYKKYFQIATIFDAMEPGDKETTDSKLSKVINLASLIEEKFAQLSKFCLLKTNPFFYSERMPEFVINNIELYTKFINSNNQRNFLKIKLDYSEICKAENSLGKLLQRLCYFHEQMNYKREDITINDVGFLKQELRDNIENLIHLGIALNKHSSELLIVNKLWNLQSLEAKQKENPSAKLTGKPELGDLEVLGRPPQLLPPAKSSQRRPSQLVSSISPSTEKNVGAPGSNPAANQEKGLATNQRRSILKEPSAANLESSADLGKSNKLKSSESSLWEFPMLLYHKEQECDLSFAKASEGLSGLLTDLMTTYNQDEQLQKNLLRVRFLIDKIIVFYEQKRVTGLVKDSDLEVSQKTLVLLEQGLEQLSGFTREKLGKALDFLDDIDKKSKEILNTFEELVSCSTESLKEKLFARFSFFLKKFVQKCRSDVQDLESTPLKNKRLELMELKRGVEERVRQLNERWKFFQWQNRRVFDSEIGETKF